MNKPPSSPMPKEISQQISSQISNQISRLDKLGMVFSAICAVHCLLAPVVVLSLPILARYYLFHPGLHYVFGLGIVPVGLWAFIRGYQQHRNPKILFFGIPGLLIVSLVPVMVHALGVRLNEPFVMLIGSLMVILAHILNRRSCRCGYHHH